MISSQQLPRKIKHLEVISKVLLLILPLSVIFAQICGDQYKFYVFYKNITPLVWLFPLLLAIALKIISILLQKKNSLPINRSIRNFLKLLLLMAFISGLIGILLSSPCGSTEKAKDARIQADLYQAKHIMDSIYEIYGNYDNFNCEYGVIAVICQDVNTLRKKKPLIGIESWYAENGNKPIITHDTRNNSQAVCIYSSLNVKKDYWYCVDNLGRARTTEIDPGSSGYCIEGKSAVCP